MMINLSNHPSTAWEIKQYQNAVQEFHEVIDMMFPFINPEANAIEIDLLVENYFAEIKKLVPQAVHIMGELTFTFRMVTKLKNVGITCIASTTKRNVIEKDGAKVSRFEFVKFREY
jgi:methionine aminopeptidase